MLRAVGRKNLELEIEMRNSAELGTDRAIQVPSSEHVCKLLALRVDERRTHANCAKSKRFLEIGKEN